MMLLLFIATAFAAGSSAPPPIPTWAPLSPTPGQGVALEFPHSEEKPWVRVGKKNFPVFRCPKKTKWCGLLVIPLGAKGKEYVFETGRGSRAREVKLTLSPATYGSETLRVDPAKVKLNPKSLKRVMREREILGKVYGAAETPLNLDGPFVRPGKGKVTSSFGRSRVFNGEAKSYHTGVDLAGNTKTRIYATNRGRVVLAQNLFFAGNVVIVDHGMGIFSTYGHLSRFSVKEGALVKKGQVLGRVGATGRVTGPHLHFGLRINGELADPLQVIALVNRWWEESQGE